MKKILVLWICILLTSMTAACSHAADAPDRADNTGAAIEAKREYTDFEGKNIGVITNTLCYFTAEKIGAVARNYAESPLAVTDIRRGDLDGFIAALSGVRAMAAELGRDTFEAIEIPAKIFAAQIGGFAHDQDVTDRFNAFLSEITADGTLDKMKSRWIGETLDLTSPMPDIPNSGENGVLKVATTSDAIPYAYLGADGVLKGFSVELALRFGAYEGKTVEFNDVEFGGLIQYIADKNADIGLANMVITEERARQVLFTDPLCDEQHGILAMK